MSSARWIPFIVLTALLANGCTRTRYRLAADRDTYRVLEEKAYCANQYIPAGYTVVPDPRSRFYDPTNPDCPQLPVQRPILNGYQLPPLMSGGPTQFTPVAAPAMPQLGSPNNASQSLPAGDETIAPPTNATPAPVEVQAPKNLPDDSLIPSQPKPSDLPYVAPAEQFVFPAGFVLQPAPTTEAAATPEIVNAEPNGEQPTMEPASPPPPPVRPGYGDTIRKVTIPEKAWTQLPDNCLNRMLQFDSLRDEYMQSFPNAEIPSLSDPNVRRLTLANLMELAIINNRDYQTRKEILYRTALAVTRQRYQFDLNPTPFGNGTGAAYRHLREDGITENRLTTPSSVGVQQTLASGGEFLARFANSVVLTFNGPSGFAADVGSEVIFDFQQTIFQRDVRFENLTQSERDVVYAVRDYLRFRKQLFRDVANLYYNLILSYRGIEISANDYFTNLRGFIQAQIEYRTAEKISRIQVDQFEQNVLRTRSTLIANCFNLESSLDQLKLRLGLPTEMIIHLDLNELQLISLKDELSVARQMINRTRTELLTAQESRITDATSLANVAEVLADRMIKIVAIQERMQLADLANNVDNQPSNSTDSTAPLRQAMDELQDHQQALQLLGARMQVDLLRSEFESQVNADLPVPPLRVLIRAIEFASSEMSVIDVALASKRLIQRPTELARFQAERDKLTRELAELIAFLEKISSRAVDVASEESEDFTKIPVMMQKSVDLVKAVDKLAFETTGDILPSDRKAIEKRVEEEVDKAIVLSDRLLLNGPDGWTDITLDQNEALLTGLVQRLDLMNQRGDIADAWRQIKLAGDDLRSIVDLRATQILRTDSDNDDPFEFSFEDSETRLSVALDTPLNRRLQRNNFRIALINYNVGLRNLLAAEDVIKLDIREDLRQLSLDRIQYEIAVASAALANERVISTRFRLLLAVQNVAARDFLEAQQAYTNALNAIARTHVNYISDRLELFFDLEAFDVDSLGHWNGVNQDYAPQINTDFQNTNPRPYDWLPSRVWYSPTIRHMEHIPPGESVVVP